MRTSALIFLLLVLFPLYVRGNGAERDSLLVRERDFSDIIITESAPENANGLEKVFWQIRKQLAGRDFYNPPNYIFFRLAVKEAGLIPAIFATADRLLRDSKVGTYQSHMDAAHPYIDEGPEAYIPKRERRKKK